MCPGAPVHNQRKRSTVFFTSYFRACVTSKRFVFFFCFRYMIACINQYWVSPDNGNKKKQKSVFSYVRQRRSSLLLIWNFLGRATYMQAEGGFSTNGWRGVVEYLVPCVCLLCTCRAPAHGSCTFVRCLLVDGVVCCRLGCPSTPPPA